MHQQITLDLEILNPWFDLSISTLEEDQPHPIRYPFLSSFYTPTPKHSMLSFTGTIKTKLFFLESVYVVDGGWMQKGGMGLRE